MSAFEDILIAEGEIIHKLGPIWKILLVEFQLNVT